MSDESFQRRLLRRDLFKEKRGLLCRNKFKEVRISFVMNKKEIEGVIYSLKSFVARKVAIIKSNAEDIENQVKQTMTALANEIKD